MIAKMKSRAARCSFCGKSQGEVTQIVAGRPQAAHGVPRRLVGKSSFICNECVLRYKNILTSSEIKTSPASVVE